MNYLYGDLLNLIFFVVVTLPKCVCVESRGNSDLIEGIGHGFWNQGFQASAIVYLGRNWYVPRCYANMIKLICFQHKAKLINKCYFCQLLRSWLVHSQRQFSKIILSCLIWTVLILQHEGSFSLAITVSSSSSSSSRLKNIKKSHEQVQPLLRDSVFDAIFQIFQYFVILSNFV